MQSNQIKSHISYFHTKYKIIKFNIFSILSSFKMLRKCLYMSRYRSFFRWCEKSDGNSWKWRVSFFTAESQNDICALSHIEFYISFYYSSLNITEESENRLLFGIVNFRISPLKLVQIPSIFPIELKQYISYN